MGQGASVGSKEDGAVSAQQRRQVEDRKLVGVFKENESQCIVTNPVSVLLDGELRDILNVSYSY